MAICDKEVITVKNEEDGHAVRVCLIRPKELKGQAPAYIYAHGGGAVLTVGENYDNILCTVARNLNCVVVNVDFRNGPEVKAPTGANDYRAVVKYIVNNGAKHNINSKRVGLAGLSGGGWIMVGACNQMIKKGEKEIHEIKCVFVQAAMLSNECDRIP